MPVTLGLDLGPNSIGWALVDSDRIIDLGVRIFPEGVDNFDTKKEKPRNEDRRDARMMRRQVRRRANRKIGLRKTLIDLDLFPSNPKAQNTLYNQDPYELRSQGLAKKLSLHEFGRVLLHLNQRRGFRSNMKRERANDAEVKGMLAEIAGLEKELNGRTLGQYIHEQHQADPLARTRGIHTQRSMLMDEFDRLWAEQAKHHPELTEQLAYGKLGKLKDIHKPIPKSDPRRNGASDLESFGLYGLIFFHRTLKPVPKEVVGACEIEPKRKRCPKADRLAQRFRLLQEVNNLRLIDNSASPPVERELNPQERGLVIDKLMGTKEATFDQIRKWIAKLPDSPAEEQIKFNLEEGKRTKLLGMVTDALLAAGGKNGAVGKSWYDLSEEARDRAVRLLIDNVDDDETLEALISECGLNAEQADAALSVDLTAGPTAGYVRFSRFAIERLLPHLERGLRLMANDESDSALHAAGYMRRDQLQRRIFDALPDPGRIHDAPIGDIPNPVVKRAIVELRKVVNAIIREYGKPDAVHIELAREVSQSQKKRSEYTSKIREIEAERDAAKQMLHDLTLPYGSRGTNILRIQLWKQQNHDCPYCGQKISQTQLFNDGQVDIDHILPYSRSLDDSQMNKVVCHRECNASKGNQTPYEWKGASEPERYEAMLQYTRHLPYPKRKRFIQKELELDDFINRQLNATGYIAKATVEYIKCLFDNEHKVLGLKGQLTAELRRQWGLNDAIRDDGQDIKTRDDHRHHAVDAVVIAMTDRSRLHKLSAIQKRGGVLATGEAMDEPWDGFRDEVVSKLTMLDGGDDGTGQRRGVSHRVQRKIAGALHEETQYGPVRDALGHPAEGTFVVRKPIEALSPNEINKIRDEKVRDLIIQRLSEHGIEIGRGKKADPKQWKQALADPDNPITIPPSKKRLKNDPDAKGTPIRKVRVLREEKTIQPIREDQAKQQDNPDLIAYVKPGSTHHLCIFEFMKNGKKKRDAIFVTQLEATNRLKRQQQALANRLDAWKQEGLNKHEFKRRKAQAMREIAAEFPLIQRDANKLTGEDRKRIPASAKFLMSLSQGELVLADWKGKDKILKFKTASSTQGQIWFAVHNDARKSTEYKQHVANANTLNARKITINPIGRVRWASD